MRSWVSATLDQVVTHMCRLEEDEEDGEAPPQYVKHNDALHGSHALDAKILSVPFLRKFIYYAKSKFAKQELTQEAFEEISHFYVEIRQAAATGVVDPRDRYAPQSHKELSSNSFKSC